MFSSSIAISPSACATWVSCAGADRRDDGFGRAGRGQRRRRGARFRARLGDIHQPLDALAQLRGDDLHPLAELAGEKLGFAAGRFAHRPRVARVGEERHGRERDDRQEEEGDDQAKAQAHAT